MVSLGFKFLTMSKTAVYFSFLHKAGLLGCYKWTYNCSILHNKKENMPQLSSIKGEILYYRPPSHRMLLLLVEHGHVINLRHEGLPHDFNKAKIALGTESNGDFGMRRDRFCPVIACSEKLRPIA